MKKFLSQSLLPLLFVLFSFAPANATSVVYFTGPGGNGSGLRADTLNNFSARFNTGVNFAQDMEGIPDIFANAHFFLSSVHGSSNPGTTGQVNQSTSGGTFSLYSPQNALLLTGMIGDGSLFTQNGGVRFLSRQLNITGGLFSGYFNHTLNAMQLDFAGLPTASYTQNVSYESVFTGRYENKITGYNTVQTGTTQSIVGYNDVLKCLDYSSIGRGCVPVDANGHILPQYIGKWLFLGSTPEGIPVYDHIPIYQTTPVFAQVPIYQQVPIYEQRQIITPVFAGWNWNSTFVSGILTGRCGCTGPTSVPEPGTVALLLSGLGALARKRFRREA